MNTKTLVLATVLLFVAVAGTANCKQCVQLTAQNGQQFTVCFGNQYQYGNTMPQATSYAITGMSPALWSIMIAPGSSQQDMQTVLRSYFSSSAIYRVDIVGIQPYEIDGQQGADGAEVSHTPNGDLMMYAGVYPVADGLLCYITSNDPNVFDDMADSIQTR